MGSSFFSQHKLNMQPRTETNYHSLLIFIPMITVTLPSIMPLVMFFTVIQGVFFLFISMHFSVIMFIFPRLLKTLREKKIRVLQGTMDLGAVGTLLSIPLNHQQLKQFKEKGRGGSREELHFLRYKCLKKKKN